MAFVDNDSFLKGRGSQVNTHNKFQKLSIVTEHIEGLDEPYYNDQRTELYEEHPKKIINIQKSPDLNFEYSTNPYQGCEHGCIYCYARNAHEYWGFSAGLDFERKIIVKRNAPELLRKTFDNPKWKPGGVMFSGNTDCYQPIERNLRITREMLKIFLEYKHPVSIITKNQLVLRDIDILQDLAKHKLVHVALSINSVREDVRLMLEPRTSTYKNRFKTIEELSKAGIETFVMNAPIIPGLTVEDIPKVIERAADCGALGAGYTIVRLNGAIGEIFKDWAYKTFPDRAEKIIHQIEACHGGKLNDSRWGTRMRGEGNEAESIRQLFKLSVKKHMPGRSMSDLDMTLFSKPVSQLKLF